MATGSPLKHLALLLLFPHFLTALPTTQDDLVINTRHGKVQGKSLSVLGGEVRVFLGIPYGKPPVEKLRFKPSEPVQSWEGVKDATRLPNSCYQPMDTAFPGFEGAEMWNANSLLSEDCLYLNVWAPRTNKTQSQPTTLAPVLVWIYGGGFYTGTSSLDIYDGRFLTKLEGVVVVSMNYRLGALGFLSLPNNNNIKGNMGLLDQQLALRWVSSNIAAFGGDPAKVTLFGESAGSVSVGYHLLSPGSQPLFQRAVMQSGSPNAAWAKVGKEEAWTRAMKLAKLLGCPISHQAQMEACLQKVEPGKIVKKQAEITVDTSSLGFPFVPTVDGTFLPNEVDVLLSTGNLPKKEVLLGLNKDEGTFFLMYLIPGFTLAGQNLISREQFLAGVALTMPGASRVALDTAIYHYTDWTDANSRLQNRDSLGRISGDQEFVCPVLEFAQRYSQRGGNTFLYSFDHRSTVNPWPEWMGVMHGYEIEFVFGRPLNATFGYTKNEVNMTKKFMKHWTNFARTGNPSIDGAKWPAFTHEDQEYVTLNFHHPEQKIMMRAKECRLWTKLIPEIQKVSDDLLTCVKGNGIKLRGDYISLLIFLVITLIY